MNEKFFSLPEEKRQNIINAGYRVFSQNSYKKSPMSEIADAAGISKALLFHYFLNKKELYLFLWEEGARLTQTYLEAYRCHDSTDLFVMMERGMQAKLELMKSYPYMASFTVKAFYEKDPQVCDEIRTSYQQQFDKKARNTLAALNTKKFVPGLDLQMMYREMYWASEGYLWEMMQRGELDPLQMEKDFAGLLKFWKQIYQRKEE